jgi:DNA-binding MarR family transcriptional regulator
MQEPGTPILDDALKEKDGTDDVTAHDVALIIAGMNRFLTTFAKMNAFRETKISIGQWLLLVMLSKPDSQDISQIADFLGIRQEGFTQIFESLVSVGILSADQPFEDRDPRISSLTELGREKLNAISDVLRAKVLNSFQGKERVIPNLENSLNALIRATKPKAIVKKS